MRVLVGCIAWNVTGLDHLIGVVTSLASLGG